jgi:quercetin dioxygenase-like cupin family protein
MEQNTSLYVNPSDETIRLGPLAVRFLVTGENSSGSVAAFELSVPGAQRLAAPAHSHDHYEETIYGIDGVLTWTVNGMQIDVGPGQTLCIARGAIHRFDNNGSKDVKVLCVHAGRDRSAVFPRVCRGDQRDTRRSAGSSKNDGNHAPPRPYAGLTGHRGIRDTDTRAYRFCHAPNTSAFGERRTSRCARPMSANDPYRTWPASKTAPSGDWVLFETRRYRVKISEVSDAIGCLPDQPSPLPSRGRD